jgi:hypothetical protein
MTGQEMFFILMKNRKSGMLTVRYYAPINIIPPWGGGDAGKGWGFDKQLRFWVNSSGGKTNIDQMYQKVPPGGQHKAIGMKVLKYRPPPVLVQSPAHKFLLFITFYYLLKDSGILTLFVW